MSRTCIEVHLKFCETEKAINIFSRIVEAYGYSKRTIDNETFWTIGDVTSLYMRCFGISFNEDIVILQGWLKEQGYEDSNLDGIMGFIPKSKMKKILKEIVQEISAINNYTSE